MGIDGNAAEQCLRQLELMVEAVSNRLQATHRLGDDFGSHAVARKNRNQRSHASLRS